MEGRRRQTCRLWVRAPRLPLKTTLGSWSNRKTLVPQSGDPGATPGDSTLKTRSCSPAAKAAPLQGDNRRFESAQDYFGPGTPNKAERLGLNPSVCGFDSRSGHMRLGRQPADHFGLEPGMLRVRVPPGLLTIQRSRGAARSARLPVTQEITGSNPVEVAFDRHGAVRKPAKRPSSNLGDCGFNSRLRH